MKIDFKHLKIADKKYLPHAFRVILVSINLLWISVAGLIQDIFPFILIDTVSDGVNMITDKMENQFMIKQSFLTDLHIPVKRFLAIHGAATLVGPGRFQSI